MDSINKVGQDIECLIPECYRNAKILALQCGGKVVGKVDNDYLHNGKWYNSIMMVRKWVS